MLTIESFKRDDLGALTAATTGPCISIYLPTTKSGQEALQGSIRLKNLLKEVQEELDKRGIRWDQAESLTGPAEKLVKDLNFWQHQNEGLAIFIADGVSRAFGLPITVPTIQSVAEAFDIAPLLPP